MSKKAQRKPAPRATSKAASRGASENRDKTSGSTPSNDATAERIARALEAIAGHLSAASPAPRQP